MGKNKGNSTLYINGAGSTIYRNLLKNSSEYINIKIDTMANICKNYLKKEIKIQFCKIDVEGSEKNVLLSFDFKNYRPQVFLIESTWPFSMVPSYPAWEYILIKNNYTFVYQYLFNRFYVDNSNTILISKFFHVNKYIKLYKSLKKIK